MGGEDGRRLHRVRRELVARRVFTHMRGATGLAHDHYTPVHLKAVAVRSSGQALAERTMAHGRAFVARMLAWHDAGWWAVAALAVLALAPRLYGLNWDANDHLHPDERQIVYVAMCLGLPGAPGVGNCLPAYTGPGWLLSAASPLNPHFFAYGSLPIYLLAFVAHGLAWISAHSGGRFAPPDGGLWDDFNHFTLVGRVLSAVFDAGSVFVTGLLARRLVGRWAGVLAAALVAVTPLEVQLSHFYAVDTVLLFFVLLTLLACVRLAQLEVLHSDWLLWRDGLLVGVAGGLAVGTKISALPLLAPIAVAGALVARRHGLAAAAIALLGALGAGILTFVVTNPYALLDLANFQYQVSQQALISQGKLDYPYVRQFSETVPYLYQLREMLLFDLGLPLGVLCLAGFVWAASRLWRSLFNTWAILVVWIVVYFAIVGGAYTKYPRYMLPLYPPLIICGAGALVALSIWGVRHLRLAEFSAALARTRAPVVTSAVVAAPNDPTEQTVASRPSDDVTPSTDAPERVTRPKPRLGPPRWWRDPLDGRLARWLTARWGPRWWRGACVGLALLVVVPTLGFMLALVNIYSAPNTRVQASAWIYDHVPPGATLTYEVWDDPLPMQCARRAHRRWWSATHRRRPHHPAGRLSGGGTQPL